MGRYIKVDVDGTTWNVPLNDRYEPERGPDDDEHYRRAVQLTPRPANWFRSQINDLAGVSAAAMEMLRELDREAQAARAPIAAAATGADWTGRYMSIGDLCRHFSIPSAERESYAKRLARLRKQSADATLYRESEPDAPRDAKYLYNAAHALVAKASYKRPTK